MTSEDARARAEQIDAIRQRLEKATKAPWVATSYEGTTRSGRHMYSICHQPLTPDGLIDWNRDGEHECIGETTATTEQQAHLDAEFIAHARTDIPFLLNELTDLHARLQALQPSPEQAAKDVALIAKLQEPVFDGDRSFSGGYSADPLHITAADRLAQLTTAEQMYAAWRKRAEEAEARLQAQEQERKEALVILATQSGDDLLDACRQVKQVAVSEADNSEKLEVALAAKDQELANLKAQKVPCPNCGTDYATAQDLRAWKDQPELIDQIDTLKAHLAAAEQARQRLQRVLAMARSVQARWRGRTSHARS